MKNTTLVLPILLVVLMTSTSLFSSAQTQNPASGVQSEWVYKGTDGKLKYKTTPAGDRIMDFSHAGHMGGGKKINKT